MPTYVLKCDRCGDIWNVIVGIKEFDTALAASVCDRCGKSDISVVIEPSTFVLKGDGWAKDGYSSVKK